MRHPASMSEDIKTTILLTILNQVANLKDQGVPFTNMV